MTIEQIEHLERLNASLRIQLEESRKELSKVKRHTMNTIESLREENRVLRAQKDFELRRADSLQFDLDRMDDFLAATCEEMGVKYERKPS